jgi:hypothetical protein
LTGSHATHAAPWIPQAVVDLALQLGPEQHPLGHAEVQPEHAPALQFSMPGQAAHALPPLPHRAAVLPG